MALISLFAQLPSPMPTWCEQKVRTWLACSFKRIRSRNLPKSQFSGYTRRKFPPFHALTASRDRSVGCHGTFARFIATVAVCCCVDRPSVPCSISFVAVFWDQGQGDSCQILKEQGGVRPGGMRAMVSCASLPCPGVHSVSFTSV